VDVSQDVLYQAFLSGIGGGLLAVSYVQFVKDTPQVDFNRVLGDREVVGNFLVGGPTRHQT
jgi:hypothetical protein